MTFSEEFRRQLADRYVIERELGHGGMAAVYLARDLRHQRLVALKLLDPDLAAEIGSDRFVREIRLAARLTHPHICSVYDSGVTGDQLWFAMPFIEGESLEARLAREGTLPVEEALRIAREAALALTYAHQQGVIHRDIKPANLLLAKDGSVLVADFGIARAVSGTATGEPTLTQTGFSPGTPAYMSPEQRAGVADVDGRTDVYSLGVVLFEMLVGERPFGAGALAAFALALSDPVPRVRPRREDVPAGVDVLLQKALAPNPDHRYATMDAMGKDLDLLWRGKPLAGATARPRVGMRPVLAAAAAVVVLALGGYALLRGRLVAPDPAVAHSTAVLPFLDLSSEHSNAWFSEGLAEELTTVLAKIPGLRVAARSSAFQFKAAGVDVREVGRRLNVGTVLEGSVRRSGNRIKVSAQLVNARDGYELWSETYDRDLADVFEVQEEIARAIGAALQVRLASEVDSALRQRPTGDLEAYDLYLKGRFALSQRSEATLPEATRLFEAAVARDSSMARAWAGLADARLLLPLYARVDPKEAWPGARAAALRAIALDGRSAEAYTSLAYGTMLYEWNWADAEEAFHRALAADSTYPTAHHWYADFLAGRNRLEDALREMRRARELDPLSRIIPTEEAWILNALRRPAAADSVLGEVLRLDPSFSQAIFVRAQVRLQQRRYAEALRDARVSLAGGGSGSHGYGTLVAALVGAGDRPQARAILDTLNREATREYIPPFVFAAGYASLGQLDRAFAMLDKGIAERDALLPENFFEPVFDPLREDPRYPGVVSRLGGVLPPRTPPSQSTPRAPGG
ncbi:MAG TPA: protein kinase [Gemmatimonadales bacterium]|nr:protein kinase [Gemmatimonadales bacterium]